MTEAPSTVRDWEGRLQPGYLPFALAFGFLVLAFAYRALGLPSPSDVALVGQHLYASYGLITLFVAAFIEGLFFFGIYLPGSFVIVLAVHLAPKSFIPLATIAFVSAAGLLL